MQITLLGRGLGCGLGELQRKRKCGSCALSALCRILGLSSVMYLVAASSSSLSLSPSASTPAAQFTLWHRSRLVCGVATHSEVWQHCASSWQRNNKDKRCIVALRCGTKAKDRRSMASSGGGGGETEAAKGT